LCVLREGLTRANRAAEVPALLPGGGAP
jgi:hypothetical protein